jgi:hypothetical protein
MVAMPPIVKKPGAVQRLGPVPIDRLTRIASRLTDEAWANEDAVKENDFVVFHHTQHLIFRFIRGNRDPEDFYTNPAWDVWKNELEPVMESAIESYGFAKPVFAKAMLARLKAGHEIDRHRDGAGSNLRCHKIHVPLVTNPQATFQVGEEFYHLEPGYAWEVNNIKPHGARNLGEIDRVHFIFEVFDGAYAEAAA